MNITINGNVVQAQPGQTVIEAAEAAGVRIPSLCRHPQLKPEGSCRICLVEIEKQRTLQPACTFPVAEGMIVRTDTPKVVEARKFALQMLFSERSHYCMYCPMSGSPEKTDCELQKLGYEHGLDCWAYPPDYGKQWPVDATHPHLVIDHGRCVLCRRCIRACNTLAAAHTLGVHQRGAHTLVCADDAIPLGSSSCVSCGMCVQVCPTGAITDRASSYMGHDADTRRTSTTCVGCSVGCGIDAITLDNQLLRIEGRWDADNGALLCSHGRFDVLQPRQRITAPLIREGGQLVPTTWEKALEVAGSALQQARHVAGLISPRLPNQTLASFTRFFHEVLMSSEVALLYGQAPPLNLGPAAGLRDLLTADCIVVVGSQPLQSQKVLGYMIRRALDNGTRLVVIDDNPTDLDALAHLRLELEDISPPSDSPFERLRTTYHLKAQGISQLKAQLAQAKRGVIVYGAGLSSTLYSALQSLKDHSRFLPLVEGANAAGAYRLGLQAREVHGEALYVFLGDDLAEPEVLPQWAFTLVQSAYASKWTEHADVVFPARTWGEQRGHVVNTAGLSQPLTPFLNAPANVPADADAFLKLSRRLGNELTFDEITDNPAVFL